MLPVQVRSAGEEIKNPRLREIYEDWSYRFLMVEVFQSEIRSGDLYHNKCTAAAACVISRLPRQLAARLLGLVFRSVNICFQAEKIESL